MEQVLVVRHELVFTILHINGDEFQIVVLELANQVFQRHGIPYNLVIL